MINKPNLSVRFYEIIFLTLLLATTYSKISAEERRSGALSVEQQMRKSEDKIIQPKKIVSSPSRKNIDVAQPQKQEAQEQSILSTNQEYIVQSIQVSGDQNLLERTAVLAHLEEALLDKKLTGAAIQDVVDQSWRDLVNKGYYASSLKVMGCVGGVLTLDVDGGRFGRKQFFSAVKNKEKRRREKGDVFKGRFFSQKQLERMLKGVQEGDPFNYRLLYEGVYLINTHPDLIMDTDLRVRKETQDGRTLRYVDMDYIVQERFPIHAFLSVDNTGTKETGEWRPSLTVQHLNLTKHDDILTLYAGPFSTEAKKLKGGSASYYIPYYLGNGGSFTGYGGYADLNVDEAVPGVDIRGEGWYGGVQGAYKLISSVRHELQMSIGYVWRNVKNRLVLKEEDIEEIVDRQDVTLAPIVIGFDYASAGPDGWGGRNFFNAQTTFQFAGALGASDAEEIKKMRDNAEADYVVERLSLSRLQPVFDFNNARKGPWLLYARVGGQFSNGPLVPAEQMAFGGIDTVRGFPDGIILGDQGVTAKLELRTPLWAGKIFKGKTGREEAIREGTALDRLQLVTFVDYGYANIEDPKDEKDNYTLASVGLGFRFSISSNFQMLFDYGFPLVDMDEFKKIDDDASDNGQFHFRAQLGF